MFLMFHQNSEFRHKYGESIIDTIYVLMKELKFSYEELINMDLMTFKKFRDKFKSNNTSRIDTIKDIQKNNPSHFMFTLEL